MTLRCLPVCLVTRLLSFFLSGSQLPDVDAADAAEPGPIPGQRRLWIRAEAGHLDRR